MIGGASAALAQQSNSIATVVGKRAIEDARSTLVSYRDLNLAAVEGEQTLHRRVKGAARSVCGPNDDQLIERPFSDCVTHRAERRGAADRPGGAQGARDRRDGHEQHPAGGDRGRGRALKRGCGGAVRALDPRVPGVAAAILPIAALAEVEVVDPLARLDAHDELGVLVAELALDP